MNEEYVLYVGQGCGYCNRAKAELDKRELPYCTIDAKSSLYFQKEFKDKGVTSVPQIFQGDRYIGGCDQLVDELEAMEITLDD